MRQDSPSEVFRAVASRHRRAFWLDGGGARGWSGSRSLIGWLDDEDVSLSYDAATRRVTRHSHGRTELVGTDIFAVLEREIDQSPPGTQWFGYFGYAAHPELPARPSEALPDAVWMRSAHVHVFDHASQESPSVVASSPPVHRQLVDPVWYRRSFEQVRERLLAGDSYETNLTYRATVRSGLDPIAAYLRLRILNPGPYSGFLQHDVPGARAWLLSSSPERYATVGADRMLETRPIKGTTSRYADPSTDERARRRLESDPKYRAENLMIVDLLRHDLAAVCQVGTVAVPSLMRAESYATVHQLVSTVEGRLRPEVSTVGALRSLFPAGSMTGAPKRRTMEIIEEVEESARGPYAGAFGWIHPDGRADLGVVIRSLVTDGSGTWTLGTGGGITVDSDVEDELAETLWKADALVRVFGGD
jgi:para-aminobenzoate synthetase